MIRIKRRPFFDKRSSYRLFRITFRNSIIDRFGKIYSRNMKKNDIVEILIDSYADGGEGVGRIDGLAVFVPFTIKGELVKAKIILLKKNYAVGKLVEVLTSSSSRVNAICPNFTKCGGCQLQHMDDKEEDNFKKQKVEDSLKRIGKVDVVPNNTVNVSKRMEYRNKLEMPFALVDGKITPGFFAPYSHRVVPTTNCIIQSKLSMDVLQKFTAFANEVQLSVYNEETGKGLLRHLVVRENGNSFLATVVINGKNLPKSDLLIAKFKELNVDFGLYINVNTKNTNVVFSDEFRHIFGLQSLQYEEDGIKYSVYPQSFLQVNDLVAKRLYDDALEFFGEKDVVINGYSGAGLLTARLAKKVKKAYGIEIVKECTISADKLKEDNGIDNMHNITGDCAIEMPKLIKNLSAEEKEHLAVLLDPPRKGVEESILRAILEVNPKKIVYISCNPSTLARDIAILSPNYSPKSATPYNMFPKTKHVETVAYLERKE